MIVKNKKTKQQYPISKEDWDKMAAGVKSAFEIISNDDSAGQQIQAIQIGQSTKTVEPSTGQKKTPGKKKDEKTK